jgi:BirA family biotin operon repressor/biotin-[acetyl-CoA-carboxylase] ligase
MECDLRWPNDLLLGGKKFCGILAEMNAEPARVRYLALGIGMNVNHLKFPAELRELATSLRLQSPAGAQAESLPRLPLLAALLRSLHREYRALLAGEDVRARFAQHSSYAEGKKVFVEEQGGYSGTTAGLDENGFLLVRTGSETRRVISGGVRAQA